MHSQAQRGNDKLLAPYYNPFLLCIISSKLNYKFVHSYFVYHY
ncbi:hypothetical protein [uncultured Gammaproteobacteria bacterium]|nr:hypothetical protein [uncultured Gammaproteobacteria bacterium]